MNPLIIPPTEHSPKIVFDIEKLVKGKHVFEISGESKPEDVKAFYDPILHWLDEAKSYLQAFEKRNFDNHKRKIRIKFKMDYFNSSSAKFLFDIIQKLEKISKTCHHVSIKIVWLFASQDRDMQESGEEFKSMTSLPFEITTLLPRDTI